MVGAKNVVVAVAVLALGVAGVALAGVRTDSASRAGATQVNVAVMDGKLTVSPTSFPAGTITLVVVNKGKKAHGLAIMGTGLSPKRTPSIAAGKTAKLTVTVKAGKYHIWDHVQSSMTHAKYLTAKTVASSSSSGSKSTGGSSGSGSSGGTSGSGGAGGTMTTSGTDTAGMEACDHM